jgi:hypothetical protein
VASLSVDTSPVLWQSMILCDTVIEYFPRFWLSLMETRRYGYEFCVPSATKPDLSVPQCPAIVPARWYSNSDFGYTVKYLNLHLNWALQAKIVLEAGSMEQIED